METILIDAARESGMIPIGKQGENEALAIVFDVSRYLALWPNATVSLAVVPPQGDPYPATVSTVDGKPAWIVTSSDTYYPGMGKVELRVLDDGMVKKSATFQTNILESFTAEGDPPDPLEDWLDDAAEALGDVETATALISGMTVSAAEAESPSATLSTVDGHYNIAFGLKKGDTGATGADGYSPTASVSKSGDTATITITDKNGTTTAQVSDGQDGADGSDGTTFTPAVSSAGVISWTNDGGKTNPSDVNLTKIAQQNVETSIGQRVDVLHNLVDYGYATESSVSYTSGNNNLTASRNGTKVVINGTLAYNGTTLVCIRLNGELALNSSHSNFKNTGGGIALKDGHKYRWMIKIVSGAINTDNWFAGVYKQGRETPILEPYRGATLADGTKVYDFQYTDTDYPDGVKLAIVISRKNESPSVNNAVFECFLEDITHNAQIITDGNINYALRDSAALSSDFSTGKFFDLSGNIGSVVNVLGTSADFCRQKVACHAGDTFVLTAQTDSTTGANVWAFTDSDNKLLKKAADGANASGLTLIADQDGYLLVNALVNESHTLTASLLYKAVSDVQVNGTSIVNNGVANIPLNPVESVSGSTPSITAMAGVRYVCGEVSTLAVTVPASGCVDVVFESGSTPTVLTVTSAKSGVTAVKWANGWDGTCEANTTYEINILDGEYGVVGSWT